MISNSAEFRPLRWLTVAVVLALLVFAGGVLVGVDPSPAPSCTVGGR